MKPIEFTVTFRPDWFVGALALLFAFGLWYNRWVESQQDEGYDRGYMGFIVALGCLVTLILGLFAPTLNTYAFGIALAAFVASGVPMIRGSILRFNRARAEKRMDEMAEETKRMILESDRRPLSQREQALLEGIMTGLKEVKEGVELASLGITQLYDPIWTRDSGNGDDEELADGVIWAIARRVRSELAKEET